MSILNPPLVAIVPNWKPSRTTKLEITVPEQYFKRLIDRFWWANYLGPGLCAVLESSEVVCDLCDFISNARD